MQAAAIILTILALIIALSYTWISEVITIAGIFRPDIKPYDGGKCRVIKGVETCEDILIHHRTGHAFMACGNATIRSNVFYPPINLLTNTTQLIRETPYIYDINNDKLIPLELKNFPPEEDFLLCGMGIYEDEKNEPNKLYVFFANHKKSGSVIEIFEHILNTNELVHLSTVKHDLIITPNDVVPVSKDEFYVTNDHSTEFYRLFDDIIRRPWGNVVFHSSITNTTEIVADGLSYPNGITSNWDNSKIYVGTSTGGEVMIYDRKSNNKLHLSDRLFVGLSVDNLSVDEQTGEIYCAATQKPLAAFAYMIDRTSPPQPAAVIKISNNTAEDKFYGIKYSHKIIFEDNGSILPSVSIAAVDRQRNVMLLGTFRGSGIARCELDL
ncbi:hypothetical protein RclHR1_07040011 [Rhizophagus clarus]|uniref:Arylesterase-domain-containing protein n=1 Tax=Rhizophagus clarus TaxID=94130 RepID=A0A2Z6RUK6_9GLOM|nr:hypothetical protein RclHR1_07040011 [Rhizophagus clarus]GES79626.1 arylesterase-domain-containing protein [Rhizophagus clarus]